MLEKLKSTFDKGFATVSAKSESLAESGRVKATIYSSQKRLETELNAIAPRIYAAWKEGGRSLDDFADDFARIQIIEQEIAVLQNRLNEIKQEEEARIQAAQTASANPVPQNDPIPGGSFCAKCGRALPPGSRFCDVCGTPVATDPAE